MHKIRALFFDLDGTLIDPATHLIPDSTIQALQELEKKGYLLFPATGRSIDLLRIVERIDEVKWSGYVCSNGQCLFDKDGTLLKASYFSPEQIQGLLAFTKQHDMTVTLVCAGYTFAPYGIDANMIRAYDFFHETLPEQLRPYHEASDNVFMALIFQAMSFPFHQVESIEGLKALPNHSTYADVLLSEISKASGISFMCERFGIQQQETMSFGDGSNDLDMINYAEIGVAMGNASDDVKKAADYLTAAVSEDGIVKALQHFQLL